MHVTSPLHPVVSSDRNGPVMKGRYAPPGSRGGAMNRRRWWLGGFLALGIVTAVRAATLVNGAGATFPYPLYSKWFDEFHKRNPDVQINYQSIGSGGGIR